VLAFTRFLRSNSLRPHGRRQ